MSCTLCQDKGIYCTKCGKGVVMSANYASIPGAGAGLPPLTTAPGESNKTNGGALRYDTGKLRLELISPIAMEGLASILTFGAKKYAAHNWRKGMDWSRCIGSLKRHLSEFEKGNDYDFDPNCEGCKKGDCKNHSGLLHIDQVMCNAMFLAEYVRTHKELDDRYKGEKA